MATSKLPAVKSDLEKAEEVAKTPAKRGGKSASIEKTGTATATDIQKTMGNLLYWYGRERVKTDDECADRLNEFFRRISETGEIPTVEKMALALGTIRQTVWEWEQGKIGIIRADMIKKAKEMLAAIDADLVSKGKIPQITYIFRSKNYFGLKDKQELVVTPNNTLGDYQSQDELSKRYAQGVGDYDELPEPGDYSES